jgi:uncharacterized Zn finger protein
MRLSRTWWGNKFIDALINFMDEGRLKRGRSYSGPNRILSLEIDKNTIKAKIRGNINPYFGVYKEPKYKVSIKIKKITEEKWKKIISGIALNSGWLCRLMLNEIPDQIDQAFLKHGEQFLPRDINELTTRCSCPDWENPCKHIAGAYYKIASLLDEDPFLLFQLRGISKEKLHKELAKTELGQALAKAIAKETNQIPLISSASYYTLPLKQQAQDISLRDYWYGMPLEKEEEKNELTTEVAAILIKKQSDFPPFWPKDRSFVDTMENLYDYIRRKVKHVV